MQNVWKSTMHALLSGWCFIFCSARQRFFSEKKFKLFVSAQGIKTEIEGDRKEVG